ncbi:hypothetical protein FRC09_019751 [Ceratobasidium sp. 395]|nr:hypothetical protein FRC09_019751 [Ceratobasidium sp. 395]
MANAPSLDNLGILDHYFQPRTNIVPGVKDGQNVFFIASPPHFALTGAVIPTYHYANRRAQMLPHLYFPICNQCPIAKPDIFRLLTAKGYDNFFPKYNVTAFCNYSMALATIYDAQDFAHSTQWWVKCMGWWLRQFAVEQQKLLMKSSYTAEEDIFKPSDTSSFELLSAPSNPQSSLYAQSPIYALPSTPEYSPVISVQTLAYSAGHTPDRDHVSPVVKKVTSWLQGIGISGPAWPASRSPPPIPPPTPVVHRKRSIPVLNYLNWIQDKGDSGNTLPAELLLPDNKIHKDSNGDEEVFQYVLNKMKPFTVQQWVNFSNFIRNEMPLLLPFLMVPQGISSPLNNIATCDPTINNDNVSCDVFDAYSEVPKAQLEDLFF